MSSRFGTESTAEEIAQVFANEIKGKSVLITGASPNGLGFEAARVIAKYAALVIVAGRDQTKLDATVKIIKEETPTASLRTLVVDLGSFSSVRKAAAEVNAYTEPIHVLINNAASIVEAYAEGPDGYETQLTVNHLGPFLFTALIFPKLKSSGSVESPARVVNVSSEAHQRGAFPFDDPKLKNTKDNYIMLNVYPFTKTANILVANEIARRAQQAGVPVLAYSLHPGVIETAGFDKLSDALTDIGVTKTSDGKWDLPIKTLGQGAATHIIAAFDPSIISQSGAYLLDTQVNNDRADYAKSEENGRRLWELTESFVSEKFEI